MHQAGYGCLLFCCRPQGPRPLQHSELSCPIPSLAFQEQAPSNTHSCETSLLGAPRDEAICGLDGLLRAAKGQALGLGVLGVRAGLRTVTALWPRGGVWTWALLLIFCFPPLQRERGHGAEDRRGYGTSGPSAHENVSLLLDSVGSSMGAC